MASRHLGDRTFRELACTRTFLSDPHPRINGPGYAVGQEGVSYLTCDTPASADRSRRSLRHWNAKPAQDRLLATLDTIENFR
jgi:hypothetical protein